MTTTSSESLTFYPAYCHKASPTHFSWVKLRASDVHHALTERSGFQSSGVYFYLNHPIQFVCLVGVIIVFEDFYEKRWLFTIDDSSGETIEVMCPKPVTNGGSYSLRSEQQEPNADAANRARVMQELDVGSVVKLKGTISTFRNVRQITLERISIVEDTNAEARFWQERIQLFNDVLSKPWSLSVKQRNALLTRYEEQNARNALQAAKSKEHENRRLAREERHEERIARRYARDEMKRTQGAEEAKRAALAMQCE
ncbi:MAG: hypothetical protein Q9227_000932 [Pyrenula ochraceoflavens]